MPPPIKRYEMNGELGWEGRYRELEKHHEKETTFLLGLLKRVHETLGGLRAGHDEELGCECVFVQGKAQSVSLDKALVHPEFLYQHLSELAEEMKLLRAEVKKTLD